jgi:peptide chain release factor 2
MDEGVRAKLDELVEAFADVERQLSDPDLLSDQERYAETAQRHAELRTIIDGYQRFQQAETDAREASELASVEDDEEMAAEFRQMAEDRRAEASRLEEELWLALAPKDPNDDKDVLIEIRAAAGGDEAAIWAGDLRRMFERFAERRGFKTEVIEASPSEAGGYSKVSIGVKGKGAFSAFKFESGVHRVQRVPKTESQGRIHTSTATVAVLPEVESVEVDLDLNDVRVDVYRSSGPGGQSVNTTDSAVRMTHLPTGIVVSMQNEKSQIQNRAAALRVLQSRLLLMRKAEEAAERKELAGDVKASWGDQMRSYVLQPYQMVKDLRTEHEVGSPDKVFDGDIDEFIEAGIRWRKSQEKAEAGV